MTMLSGNVSIKTRAIQLLVLVIIAFVVLADAAALPGRERQREKRFKRFDGRFRPKSFRRMMTPETARVVGLRTKEEVIKCGEGTELVDEECVPTYPEVKFGEGTALKDGVCVSVVETVTCGEGTALMDGVCVSVVEAVTCGAGTVLVDGECVAVECTESWSCTEWTGCSAGQRTRNCTDANNCGTEEDRPNGVQECEEPLRVEFFSDENTIFTSPYQMNPNSITWSPDGLWVTTTPAGRRIQGMPSVPDPAITLLGFDGVRRMLVSGMGGYASEGRVTGPFDIALDWTSFNEVRSMQQGSLICNRFWIADSFHDMSLRFDSGVSRQSPTTVRFASPWAAGFETRAVASDSSGNMFVLVFNTRTADYHIKKWAGREGQRAAEYESSFNIGGGLIDSMDVDESGNVYVIYTNAAGEPTPTSVAKYNSVGELVLRFGSDGSDDGQFDNPGDLVVDPEGNIWVADTFNHRIQKFDPSGNHLLTFGSETEPRRCYWPTDEDGRLDGRPFRCDRVPEPGRFDHPTGIDIDPDGAIWVIASNAIQKLVLNE